MKFIYGLLVGCAFTLVSASLITSIVEKRDVDETETIFWEHYDRKHAYAVLDRSAHLRERIMNAERSFISEHLPEDQMDPYMDFFSRGLNSAGAAVMLEGERNQYLELAYRRGLEMKQIFADGYRIAVREYQSGLLTPVAPASLIP
ncbi:MAG: hypothetical protein ACOC4K_01815 [Verrucomicrobiota bacterium]